MSDSYRNQWMTKEGSDGYSGFIKGIDSAIAESNDKTVIVPGNTSSVVFNNLDDLIKEKQLRLRFRDQLVAEVPVLAPGRPVGEGVGNLIEAGSAHDGEVVDVVDAL